MAKLGPEGSFKTMMLWSSFAPSQNSLYTL